MAFLSPWMLWGALAAGIPLALHFFYRSRYRIVPWAAMEFLLTSIQQTSRRLKFQELLLLLLRCALLGLMALALARPTMRMLASGRGEAIDAVLLMDVSASMGAREGTTTRFDQARQAALQIINQLPPASTVQVITCSDRATLVGPRSPGNLDQARELLETLQVSDQASDLFPGIVEAIQALDRGHSPNREIYLLSDMQKLGWEQQAASIKARLQAGEDKTQVYAVRCGGRSVRNASLVGLVGQSGIPHVGERTTYAVLVRNTGREPLRDLTVTLTVDGRGVDRDSQVIANLAPGETLTVPLTAKLVRAGQQAISATVGPDDLDGDNRLDQIIQVRDQLRVLVVDGASSGPDPAKSASFFLQAALQPVPDPKKPNYHIQPRMVTPRLASPALLQDRDLCILVDVPLKPGIKNENGQLSGEFLERLATFVHEGHGLLIFGGPHVEPDAYNQTLEEKYHLLPLLLGKLIAPPAEKRFNPDINSAGPYSYLAAFREKPLDTLLANVDVKQVLDTSPLTTASDNNSSSRTDLSLTSGKPLLASRTVGRGAVILCTTSADARWTDLPLWPAYIPLVHSVLAELVQSGVQSQNRKVGQQLLWNPQPTDDSRSFRLTKPSGDIVDLGYPRNDNGEAVLAFSDTTRAGIYRIAPVEPEGEQNRVTRPDGEERKDASGAIFAVTPDVNETRDLDSFTDAEMDEQAGVPLIHLTAGQEISGTGAERTSREWTVWLLGALLVLLIGETALAWYCGRSW